MKIHTAVQLKVRSVALGSALLYIAALMDLPTNSFAEDAIRSGLSLPGHRQAALSAHEHTTLRFTPVTMSDGSRLTLIAPSVWSDIADDISNQLVETHQQLTDLFGAVPPFRSSVRLLDEPTFYELTGAPGWTNAMFFRGEIIIPLAANAPIDLDNLHRSVKHEYSHAVLSALSGGLIPGWLDEGLAQWLEGEENPALRSSLRSYLLKAAPVPLSLLQGGFTKLAPRMVPAAYAQSLIAVQALLKAYGIDPISKYLQMLREQVSKEDAFYTSFGVSESDFEARLNDTLRSWAGTPRSGTTTTARKIGSGPRITDRAARGESQRARP